MPADYEAYLLSDHWQSFRRGILAVRHRCERCNLANSWARFIFNQGLNVHHLNYECLGNERPEDVEVLCRMCHAKEHEKPVDFTPYRVNPIVSFADSFRFPGEPMYSLTRDQQIAMVRGRE